MGKARRIVLRTRTFEKVGDATDFFRKMLNRYKIGERVSDADAEDLDALLDRHEDRVGKVGSGILYFKVSSAPDGFSGKCFWVVRNEGEIDFSYPYCLAKKAGE